MEFELLSSELFEFSNLLTVLLILPLLEFELVLLYAGLPITGLEDLILTPRFELDRFVFV